MTVDNVRFANIKKIRLNNTNVFIYMHFILQYARTWDYLFLCVFKLHKQSKAAAAAAAKKKKKVSFVFNIVSEF